MKAAGGPLFDIIRSDAVIRAAQLPVESRHIVAAWATEYKASLGTPSFSLHLNHVCVQTNVVGSSYYQLTGQPSALSAGLDLMGKDVLEIAPLSRFWQIASLDALYGSIVRAPDFEQTLSGSPRTMSVKRAEIVCDQVERLSVSLSRRVNIVNVGVVGDFLERLQRNPRFDLTATDYRTDLTGHLACGVQVSPGAATLRYVANADIALVTGMTLATNTLDDILQVANASGTKVVLFAQTGAHFAEFYLDAGADTVISEPYPFYLSGSPTCIIRVYRGAGNTVD